MRRERLFSDLLPPLPGEPRKAVEKRPEPEEVAQPEAGQGEGRREAPEAEEGAGEGPEQTGKRATALDLLSGWLGWLLELPILFLVALLVAAALPVFWWYAREGLAPDVLAREQSLADASFVGIMKGTGAAITLFLYALILFDFLKRFRDPDAAGREWLDVVLRAFALAFISLLPTIEGHCGARDWAVRAIGIGGVVLLLALVRYVIVPLDPEARRK